MYANDAIKRGKQYPSLYLKSVWSTLDYFYLLVKAIQRAKFCVVLCVRACICASVKNEIGKQLCFLRFPSRKYKNLEFSNAVNS